MINKSFTSRSRVGFRSLAVVFFTFIVAEFARSRLLGEAWRLVWLSHEEELLNYTESWVKRKKSSRAAFSKALRDMPCAGVFYCA